MNPSWILYVVLACQPILTIIIVLACLLMYHAPVDNGFRMIAVLAGARVESLRIPEGASFSGKLSKPLRMRIVVHDTSPKGETEQLQNEYIFGSEKKNESLSGYGRSPNTRLGSARRRKTFQLNHPRDTQYEMI